MMKRSCGTWAYWAPEILRRQPYDYAVDMWCPEPPPHERPPPSPPISSPLLLLPRLPPSLPFLSVRRSLTAHRPLTAHRFLSSYPPLPDDRTPSLRSLSFLSCPRPRALLRCLSSSRAFLYPPPPRLSEQVARRHPLHHALRRPPLRPRRPVLRRPGVCLSVPVPVPVSAYEAVCVGRCVRACARASCRPTPGCVCLGLPAVPRCGAARGSRSRPRGSGDASAPGAQVPAPLRCPGGGRRLSGIIRWRRARFSRPYSGRWRWWRAAAARIQRRGASGTAFAGVPCPPRPFPRAR